MAKTRIDITILSIERLLRRGAKNNILNILTKTRAADIAQVLRNMKDQDRNEVFEFLVEKDVTLAAETLSEMPNLGPELLKTMSPEEASPLIQELESDDATALLAELEPDLQEAILKLMESVASEEVQTLLQYPEETAGRIMSQDYFALGQDLTVKEAIEQLQSLTDLELAFYLYVIDENEHLLGVVSLRQLVLNPPEKRLREIMATDVIRVHTNVDQEEVSRNVERYNLLAVPVVNDYNCLVGIVTVDDVIDIIKDEATEDIYKMAGVSEEEALFQRSAPRLAWTRFPWLLATLAGGVITMFILSFVEPEIRSVLPLVFFIPIIMGMSGNIGSQSSTIIVRGLATGRIESAGVVRVLRKQIGVGLLMGLANGLIFSLLAGLLGPYWKTTPWLGAVVGTSMFASNSFAAVLGVLMPLSLRRIKVDPALASGPFVTTMTDIISLMIFFGIAMLLLRYL